MNMKYLYEKYVKEIEIDDLDLTNKDNIFGYNEEGHEVTWITDIQSNGWYHKETQEIEIDFLIEKLKGLKKIGANYVEIMHHSDHNGYVLNALEMREATKEEIAEYHEILKKEEQRKKEEKIALLEKQILELKK